MTGLGIGVQPDGPLFHAEIAPEVWKQPLGPMPYTPPYASNIPPLQPAGHPSPFGEPGNHFVPVAPSYGTGHDVETYFDGHAVPVPL